MKNLLKLAKQKTRIPHFNYILCKNGTISAFNGEICIEEQAPPDMVQGVYEGSALAAGIVKKLAVDVAVADRPQRHCKPEIASSEIFGAAYLLDALNWLIPATSKEETRYYLGGVHFAPKRLEATDGFQCRRYGKRGSKLPFILPVAAAKYLMALIKEHKPDHVMVAVHETQNEGSFVASFHLGPAKLFSKTIDGTFPDIERILPRHNSLEIKFNPRDIAKTVKQAKALGCEQLAFAPDGSISCKKYLKPDERMETYPLVGSLSFGGFDVGINRLFLEDLPDGSLSFLPPSPEGRETCVKDPLLFTATTGDKTAIIMPWRVAEPKL